MATVPLGNAAYRHGEQLKVDHTPAATIAAGTIMLNGTTPAVANLDMAPNTDGRTTYDGKGALSVTGVYDVQNPDDTAFAAGAVVGWDDTAKKAVGATLGDFDIGVAAEAYVAGELAVRVIFGLTPTV
jgi:predicted RecA/RadA family phage recombinase